QQYRFGEDRRIATQGAIDQTVLATGVHDLQRSQVIEGMQIKQRLILVIDAQATLIIDLDRFLAVLEWQLEGQEVFVRRDRGFWIGADFKFCAQWRNAGAIGYRNHLRQAALWMIQIR